jgi:hypothetical protein
MATIVDSAIAATKKPVATRSLQAILSGLRGIKQPEEIALIAKAAAISCDGHNDVMRAIKPGMTEYQAQAIMEYHFKTNGSEYPGYPSIVGAAENACVLHYITNLKLMNDGDLLLSDCAAEYHGYTADVTRTVPANGKFSPEQKIIYELVLAAQDAGIAAQADQMGLQRQIQSAGLFGTGAGLLNTQTQGMTGAYSPFQTQLGLSGQIEQMSQQPYNLGLSLGTAQGAQNAAAAGVYNQGQQTAAQTRYAGEQAANAANSQFLSSLIGSAAGGMSGGAGAGAGGGFGGFFNTNSTASPFFNTGSFRFGQTANDF